MVTVRELLALAPFEHFTLVAGERGLGNAVSNVTILDYETQSRDFDAFETGDFVLSALFFAKDDPNLAAFAFGELLRREIAALAVKTIYFRTLPDALLEAADRARVPVFLYHTTPMEDVIVRANDYMRHRRDLHEAALRLDRLLGKPETPYPSARAAREIDPLLLPRVVAAFATSREGTPLSDPAVLFRLERENPEVYPGMYSIYLSYERGVLLLHSFDERREPVDHAAEIDRLFAQIHIPRARRHVGVSEAADTHAALGQAVREALYANLAARAGGVESLRYAELGMDQYLIPLLSSETAMRRVHSRRARLFGEGDRHAAALRDTLCALVQARGDVKAAAAALFQHPNTVRYRLGKAASLLGMDAGDGAFYAEIAALVRLDALQKALEESE